MAPANKKCSFAICCCCCLKLDFCGGLTVVQTGSLSKNEPQRDAENPRRQWTTPLCLLMLWWTSLQSVAQQMFPVKTISVYNMLTYLRPISTLCPWDITHRADPIGYTAWSANLLIISGWWKCPLTSVDFFFSGYCSLGNPCMIAGRSWKRWNNAVMLRIKVFASKIPFHLQERQLILKFPYFYNKYLKR